MYKWQINTPDPQLTEKLERDTGFPGLICKILVSRGISTREAADIFFNRTELSDPFTIKDMEKAANALAAAVESGTRITIFGDYDCDGVTSTYMLYSYLQACGAEADWYIPTRDEGYGLDIPALELLKKRGTELIITVDTGISAAAEAQYIKDNGMKLIVTDHHQVPEEMPEAIAVVDPHRPDDTSEYKEFAGCGVVLKLLMALETVMGGDAESVFTQYADIAALGTIADVVDLGGENRIIVREGLRLMENTENMGLNRLLLMSGWQEGQEITASFIGYKISPKINAAGRIGTPAAAMETLLAETMNTAASKALTLCELNTQRKELEDAIVAQTDEQIRKHPELLDRRLLIVSGDNWQHGVVGLASGELLKKYGKPNIVITREGETSRGSARSMEGLNMFEMLESCADLLIRHGGHPKAAGLTVATDRLADFERAAYAYCGERIKETCVNTLVADIEATPDDLTTEAIEPIANLEPFGEGNREPLFLLRGCVIKSKKGVKEGKSTSFGYSFGGRELRAVYSRMAFDAFPYSEGDCVDMIVTLTINEFRGERSISAFVRDMRRTGFDQQRWIAAKTAYEDYRCGRVDGRLLVRMIPTDEERRKVYDIIRGTHSLSKAELTADRAGINCCKFGVILDMFEEFGLVKRDITADSVVPLPVRSKVDLEKSKVLAKLRAAASAG